MYRLLRILVALVLLGSSSLLDAGGPDRQIRKADRKFYQYAYYKALHYYERAIKKDPTNPKVNLRIADCYRHLNDPSNAEGWYREALAYPVNYEDGQNILYMIRVLMSNENYYEAAAWARMYLARYPGDELASNLLEGSESYTLFLKDSTRYKIANLNINTSESDFGPTIQDSSVIFSSARDQERLSFGWNGRYFLQLYIGSIAENSGQLEDVKPFDAFINSKYHEAIVTFTPERDAMYFTRNNYIKKKRGSDAAGATLLKIYKVEKGGDGWKKPEELHFNSADYSVGHPSLSSDGKVMYFTSDMPGGYGGTDIYKVDLEGKEWGQPVNLGDIVNTPADEMFPWISNDGVLYFASKGHPGLGGLDIFLTKEENGNFTKPTNFGAPINSSRDDFQLVFADDLEGGYFSSNREGGKGDDDIYSFRKRSYQYKGLVLDKVTQEPIEMALVQLAENDIPRQLNFTDREGAFVVGLDSLFKWDIVVAAEGYQTERVKLHSAKADKEGLFATIEMVRCGTQETPGDTSRVPSIVLSGVLRDDKGSPVPTGKVRIIREINVEDSEYKAYLEPGKEYIVEVESSDFPQLKPRVYDVKTNLDGDQIIPLETVFGRDELPPGRVFYIVYYDFDKFNIREPDARPELDRVVSFMKAYPEVSVELGSHTDSRGTFMYNESLSKNRAVSAFDYINSRGIAKDRLSFHWFGERKLTNGCADGVECSEPDHQLNRRTEFKIKGWKGGFRSWKD